MGIAMADQIISQDYLKQIFDYKDGNLYWKIKTGARSLKGAKAGYFDKSCKYSLIRIKGKSYLTHRLIYLYHHGFLPKILDHIDANKLNNKIENLRPSNLITNGYNAKISKRNKSRIKGVYWHNLMKKWAVQLSIDGKQKKLGYFENLKDAEILVKKMREQHHKEFANHG